MMLQLQRYKLEVHYIPGKEMNAADTLYRAHLPSSDDADQDPTSDTQVIVHSFLSSLPVSAKKKRRATTSYIG